MDFKELIALGSLIDKFKMIEREAAYSVGTLRKENDVEHSFELSIMCRYLAIQYNEQGGSLHIEKVILYALIHDLVEVYAGDTDTYRGAEHENAVKENKEKEAFSRIKNETTFFPELAATIAAYEAQQDEESKFVKSIDKSSYPLLQIRDQNRGRKTICKELTLQHIDEVKQKKLPHPYGKELRDSLVTYFTTTLGRDKTKKFGDFL